MFSMNRLLILLVFLAQAGCGQEPAQTGKPGNDSIASGNGKEEFIRAKTEFRSPESVCSDGKFFYVSNVGGKLAPSEKDGDGYILRLEREGSIVGKVAEGVALHAPKGMAIANGILYVSDIDRLVAIDLDRDMLLFDSECPERTVFLNDVETGDGLLYISATDISRIFTFDLKTKTWSALQVDGLTSPNGLYYDRDSSMLYCVEYPATPTGRLLRINPVTGRGQTGGTFRGSLDGVSMTENRKIIFSDWESGSIRTLDLVTAVESAIPFQKLGGPADLYYDREEKVVWIPRMIENQLAKIQLMPTTEK